MICGMDPNPTQPRLWIDTVHAAGFNEHIGDCGSVIATL